MMVAVSGRSGLTKAYRSSTWAARSWARPSGPWAAAGAASSAGEECHDDGRRADGWRVGMPWMLRLERDGRYEDGRVRHGPAMTRWGGVRVGADGTVVPVPSACRRDRSGAAGSIATGRLRAWMTVRGAPGCSWSWRDPTGQASRGRPRPSSGRCARRDTPVVAVREPGGTPLGEALRDILLRAGVVDRTPVADALLFSAARAELVSEVIRPALATGAIVVWTGMPRPRPRTRDTAAVWTWRSWPRWRHSRRVVCDPTWSSSRCPGGGRAGPPRRGWPGRDALRGAFRPGLPCAGPGGLPGHGGGRPGALAYPRRDAFRGRRRAAPSSTRWSVFWPG